MLRDYQQEIFEQIREELKHHKGVCAVLPCRSGKSWIMKEIVDSACKKGNRVLILAHRNLLIDQHRKIIENCRIASVFTEVNHLGEYPTPQLIIIDEAHISGAASYQKVCDYYNCKRVLFTATAKRLDNKPLNLAEVVINGVSGDDLIRRGYVAPYDLYAPKLDLDLSSVHMSGADFNSEELADVLIDKKIYGDIIKYYRKLANNKQAIAYCTNVRHSLSVCDLFNQNGIPAVHMDASTSEKVREQIMDDFRSGKFQVLCNCNLISEGITVPECDCCLLLRPTQSETLYIQQACRCLTPAENKRAVIIDYVGNCYAHGMPTEKRIYSLGPVAKKIRNSSREPDIIVRTCSSCMKTYPGKDQVCPYCGHNNGKTRKEIEEDEKAELEKVEKLEKTKKRVEVGMCRDFGSLVQLGIKRGMRYPESWARYILKARMEKECHKHRK